MNNENLEGSYTVKVKESEKDVYSIDVDELSGESKKAFSGVWGVISLVLTLVLLALVWWFYSMFQNKMENITTIEENLVTIEKSLRTNEKGINDNELDITKIKLENIEIYKQNQELQALIESTKAENKDLENELKKILLQKQKILKQTAKPTKVKEIKEDETNLDKYYLIKRSKVPVVNLEIPKVPNTKPKMPTIPELNNKIPEIPVIPVVKNQ